MSTNNININNKIPDTDSLLHLYEDADWSAYISEPEKLSTGVESSLKVYTAWNGNELVALARIVGDGFTIIYIQDILVKRKYRRLGIGSSLIRMILEDYSNVRQIVLMTDDSMETHAFYTSLGFKAIDTMGCRAYTR